MEAPGNVNSMEQYAEIYHDCLEYEQSRESTEEEMMKINSLMVNTLDTLDDYVYSNPDYFLR